MILEEKVKLKKAEEVLNRELCSLDEMSDDGETEQFYDAQPIVHVGD